MSNAGVKSRQPVIGDAFDLETYGRPSASRPSTARAKSPVHGKAVERRARRHDIAPLASASAMSAPAPVSETSATDEARTLDNDAYEVRLAQGSAEQSAARAEAVRTVKIRGQATPARRRPAVQIERYDRHPDRAAQWALFLGVFMVVVAIVTGT